MLRHIKLSYRKFQLAFIVVSILLLNCIYVFIVPDYSDLDSFSQPNIEDLIWTNESVPLLSPRDACPLGPNISRPEILVMVPSAIVNFERRTAIRNSWANTSLVISGIIKVIFVVGQKLDSIATSQVGNCKKTNVIKSHFQSISFRITELKLRASPMVTYCKKLFMIVIII